MKNVKLAEALFQAFMDGDDKAVRNLCAPDLKAIQNGGAPMDLTTLLGFSAAVKSVVSNFRYENPIRSETSNGFVEEHEVCGTLPDNTSLRFSACVVGTVNDSKITQLREYFDSAAVADLAAHLGQS
jgi:ketosteroid isomerase-like protein